MNTWDKWVIVFGDVFPDMTCWTGHCVDKDLKVVEIERLAAEAKKLEEPQDEELRS